MFLYESFLVYLVCLVGLYGLVFVKLLKSAPKIVSVQKTFETSTNK